MGFSIQDDTKNMNMGLIGMDFGHQDGMNMGLAS